MRRLIDTPEASLAGIGQIFPYVFGRVNNVPGIPLLTGAQGTLRSSGPWWLNSVGILDLTDVESLTRFPDSGIVQIEAERLSYTGRDFNSISLTGVVGGQQSTSPITHNPGTAVSQVIPNHYYGFCENPPGGFYHLQIANVKFNGILKNPTDPPPHDMNPAATHVVHDPQTGAALSIGVVGIDMSVPVPADSPFANPDQVAARQQYFAQREAERDAALAQSGGADPAALWGAAWSLRELQVAPRVYAVPQLGAITATVNGVADLYGTVTGRAGAQITNPAHVARFILTCAFEQTAFDDASFARAASQAASFGYRMTGVYYPGTFGDLQRLIFNHSFINIFQEGGLWRAQFRESGTPVMTLERARRTSWSMGWTPLESVVQAFNVTYGYGEDQRNIYEESARGAALVNNQTATLSLPFTSTGGQARALAAAHLRLQDHQRPQAQTTHHSEALALIRQDTVRTETPLLPSLQPWRVRAVRVALATALLELQLEEEDQAVTSPVEELMAITRQRARQALARRGRPTAEPPRRRRRIALTAAPGGLSGSLLATATVGGNLFATGTGLGGILVATATLSGTVTVPVPALLAGAVTAAATVGGALTIPVAGPTVVATATGTSPSGGTGGAASYTLTITVPSGANRMLVLLGSFYNNGAAPGTAWNVVSSLDSTLSQIGINGSYSNFYNSAAMWVKLAPTVGSHTITVNHPASYMWGTMVAVALANVAQVTPTWTSAVEINFTASPATLTVGSGGASDLTLGAMAEDTYTYNDTEILLTPLGGATELAEIGASGSNKIHQSVATLSNSSTLQWSWASATRRWIVHGVRLAGA